MNNQATTGGCDWPGDEDTLEEFEQDKRLEKQKRHSVAHLDGQMGLKEQISNGICGFLRLSLFCDCGLCDESYNKRIRKRSARTIASILECSCQALIRRFVPWLRSAERGDYMITLKSIANPMCTLCHVFVLSCALKLPYSQTFS
jgi:hypothetical protein